MECTFSWKIWCYFANELGQHPPRLGTFRQFYEGWFALPWKNNISKKMGATTFFAVAWSLWKLRNGIIFQ